MTPEVMGEMAGIIEQAIDAGYTDLTALDAAKIYQERQKELRAKVLKDVGVDDLTPEQVAALREKRKETAKALRSGGKKDENPGRQERKRIPMHAIEDLKSFWDGKR